MLLVGQFLYAFFVTFHPNASVLIIIYLLTYVGIRAGHNLSSQQVSWVDK